MKIKTNEVSSERVTEELKKKEKVIIKNPRRDEEIKNYRKVTWLN